MKALGRSVSLAIASAFLLGACATRPINPPIERYVPDNARVERSGESDAEKRILIILAFSGGGTRAAAFSYGVLEALRRTVLVSPEGKTFRLLDQVDAITGVSGGSFTALAFGLYGDKLFDTFETDFLKRNVQGALVERALNPFNWGRLSSTGWGRSELAADYYDEILFHGATFADLKKAKGPLIAVSATDISTGSKVSFTPQNFNVMCAQLGPVRLSRAAASSSAVPVVLSSVTFNNYGGTCGYQPPAWVSLFLDNPDPPRPAARAIRRLQEIEDLGDSKQRPFLHLVDGGVSDNLGLRGVLEIVEAFEALQALGQKTPLDHVRRVVVFIVNSLSSPSTNWDQFEDGPGAIDTLLKASGVPIDKFSYEAVEQLKDIEARWKVMQFIDQTATFSKADDPTVRYIKAAPKARIYPIDVSFHGLRDEKERAYLNQLPTSFVLSDEQVDRLRRAAAQIIADSPEFQRALKESGVRVVHGPLETPAR